MVITAGDDPLVGEDSAEKLAAAVKSRGEGSVFWKIPTAYHVEGMMGDYEEYRRRVAEFLDVGVNVEPQRQGAAQG